MEAEVNYSTVVFRKDKNSPNPRAPDAASAALKTDGEAAARPPCPPLLLCLGALCILLVAAVISIIYLSLLMSKQAAKLSELTAEQQRRTTEIEALQNQTEELRNQRDDLNWTLEVILNFDSFPVKDYCPNRTCQPCPRAWVPYENHCYLFYEEDAPWKSWWESRRHCQAEAADLAVINSLQEQEFISNNTKHYYDQHHGYFIGLERKDRWIWIDGRNDTFRFWINESSAVSGTCALVIPTKEAAGSWAEAEDGFQNKFICEREALIRST